jgi:hypothetical protein
MYTPMYEAMKMIVIHFTNVKIKLREQPESKIWIPYIYIYIFARKFDLFVQIYSIGCGPRLVDGYDI